MIEATEPVRTQNQGREFLGRGVAFPVAIASAGTLLMVTGEARIEASIRMILATAPGERVMRPEFGCAAWDLIFAPNNPSTSERIADAVRSALARWEPRIAVLAVSASVEPAERNVLRVEIEYVIRSTNDRRNLVFPFYTIPREEST